MNKPWELQMVAPSKPVSPPSVNRLPSQPSLQFLEGSSLGKLASSMPSVHYNALGDVLYPVGRFVVRLALRKRGDGMQTYFSEHEASISCLAVSSDGRFALSGDASTSSTTCFVWDACSGETLSKLPSRARGAVVGLAFSPDASFCLCLSDDPFHTLALYSSQTKDWMDASLVASQQASPLSIGSLAFCSYQDFQFLTMGDQAHVSFWKTEGNTLVSRKGMVEEDASLQDLSVSCSCMLDASFVQSKEEGVILVSGTNKGSLLVWEGRFLTQVVEPLLSIEGSHRGEDNILFMEVQSNPKGGSQSLLVLFSQGLLVQLSKGFAVSSWISLPSLFGIEDFSSLVRASYKQSIDLDAMLLVTSSGDLWEVSLQGELEPRLLMKGHPSYQDVTLSRNKLVSVSSQGKIHLHDAFNGHVLQERGFDGLIPSKVAVVACGEDESLIVVGFSSEHEISTDYPSLLLLDASTLEVLGKCADIQGSVSFLVCTGEGKLLVGLSQGNMAMVAVEDQGFQVEKVLSVSSESTITGMDVSEDGLWLRCTTSAFELKFVSLAENEEVVGDVVKDVCWSSHFAQYSYESQGIWAGKEEVSSFTYQQEKGWFAISHKGSSTGCLLQEPVRRPDQARLSFPLADPDTQGILFDQQGSRCVTWGGKESSNLAFWSLEG